MTIKSAPSARLSFTGQNSIASISNPSGVKWGKRLAPQATRNRGNVGLGFAGSGIRLRVSAGGCDLGHTSGVRTAAMLKGHRPREERDGVAHSAQQAAFVVMLDRLAVVCRPALPSRLCPDGYHETAKSTAEPGYPGSLAKSANHVSPLDP